MNTNSTTAYLGALKRFWWLCGIGLVAAVVAAFLSVYSFSPSTFTVHHRARPTYTASALMLVNSAANPYLRTAVTVAPPTTKAAAPATTAGGTASATSSAFAPAPTAGARPPVVHAPDTHTLVQAANLFPLLIQSDQITRQRIAMFGQRKGVVTAKAVYSFVTPSRFKQSSFPVIEVQAAAGGPKAAKRLAQETTLAFTHWLVSSQNASRVPASSASSCRSFRPEGRDRDRRHKEEPAARSRGGRARALPRLGNRARSVPAAPRTGEQSNRVSFTRRRLTSGRDRLRQSSICVRRGRAPRRTHASGAPLDEAGRVPRPRRLADRSRATSCRSTFRSTSRSTGS